MTTRTAIVPFLLLILLSCFACNNTTKQAATNNSTLLIDPENMCEASAYEDIKGNVYRLKAMVTGQFTQYSKRLDSTGQNFLPWYVNDQQDSVLLYSIPIGEPNRQGHWLCEFQVLTSLPDDPVGVGFVHLIPIGRDTILVKVYQAPEDFDYTLEQVTQHPVSLFRDFKFDKLVPPTAERISAPDVYYVRETPIKFIGHSIWMKEEPSGEPDTSGFYRQKFMVSPDQYIWGNVVYDHRKTHLQTSMTERFVKRKMINPNYNKR